MEVFDRLLADNQIPRFVRVHHEMNAQHIEDLRAAVHHALQRKGTLDCIRPGQSVCLTAGSRDVANIAEILRALCDELKAVGAKPFIIPAMGSHAGANAEGQLGILAGYGITEETMDVPIHSSMETEVIGYSKSGLEIHIDKYANAADYIIPVGRIKAHTDFRGPIESGMCKMMVIGMGKQHGAYQCHKLGFKTMAANVMEFADVIRRAKPNLFCVGLIENAYHQTCRIEAVPNDRILEEEPGLLEYAKSRMARIPFEEADILFVDEVGKDISGAGMDPNVTGRSPILGVSKPFFQRIAVFDLTDKSHGNFGGLGSADVTTQRLYRKIDFVQTYPNGITAADPVAVKIPVVMPSDRTAMQFALRTATDCDWEKGPRIVWLKNTLSLSDFYISEALVEAAGKIPNLTIGGEPFEIVFDEEGGIVRES